MMMTPVKGGRMVQFPVYLSRNRVRGKLGVEIVISERRLVRQSEQDRVIAVVEAPRGSRVRSRLNEHGHDQLLVPTGSSIWSRLFGARVVIPAKYLIGDARRRSYGLSIACRESEPVEACG
jgi:hypothetical protein